MNIHCVERFEVLQQYHTEWNHLVQHSPTNTVFQTFEWSAAWWQAFGEAYRLHVLLGFEGKSLVAIAPLVVRETSWFGRAFPCLVFLGDGPADYTDFLYRDINALHSLIAEMRTEKNWQLLDFDRIPASSPTLAVLAEEFPGWRGTQWVCDACAAYVFSPDADGSEILRKKSLRRHLNGLHKTGTVAVRHLTQAAEILPRLETFFAQHIARRAATETPSHFLDARYRVFYQLLTERLAPHQWLLFTVITLDGEPVASHYGFVYDKRFLWYKPTFSLAHARLSPGEVLIGELFQYCQTHDMAELDFTIGAETFKERFSNVQRSNTRFQTLRSGLLQHIGVASHALRAQAKSFAWIRQLRGG